MNNYKIKIEEQNPEFPVDDKLHKGVDVNGFFIVGFDEDGDPKFFGMEHISILDLAKFFANDKHEEVTEAIYIGEGLRKSYEHMMKRKTEKTKAATSLLEAFLKMKEDMEDE